MMTHNDHNSLEDYLDFKLHMTVVIFVIMIIVYIITVMITTMIKSEARLPRRLSLLSPLPQTPQSWIHG